LPSAYLAEKLPKIHSIFNNKFENLYVCHILQI
jgi:hypothetical protein